MSADKHPAVHRRRIGVVLHRWHRRLGVVAGLFVLWLAASGILLNHSAGLGLDQSQIGATWITRWYGLHAVMPERGFQAGKHWLVSAESQTVLDGRPLATPLPGPLGLVAANNLLFAANASALAVFDAQGQSVDTLRGADLPVAALNRMGSGEGVVVIADARDQRFSSRDGLGWTHYAGTVVWAASAPLPAAVKAAAIPLLSPKLPLERILLDAHSGHILGPYGPYLVDTVGVLFILLAMSGLWMFIRHRFRGSH
jgi:hypothetical protein